MEGELNININHCKPSDQGCCLLYQILIHEIPQKDQVLSKKLQQKLKWTAIA
jgi:hypothetical protein